MATMIDRLSDWRVGEIDVWDVVRETTSGSFEDDVGGISAQMAYYAILAIFPFFIFLLGLMTVVDGWFGVHDLGARLLAHASAVMPHGAVQTLAYFVNGVTNGHHGWLAIIFGFALSVWSASSAISSAIKLLNRAYDIRETRGWWRKRLLSLELSLTFAGLMLLATLLFGSGEWLAGGVWRVAGHSGWVVPAWNFGAPVLAIVLVVVAISMLYWRGPNRRVAFAWATPGVGLFVVGWLAFCVGFAYYLSNFASYNATYGSIAAAIILLVFLYWTNFLILIGGELNAALERTTKGHNISSEPDIQNDAAMARRRAG
jgi:membrane protein